MNVKSERLKKLETELSDLEQWMNLGLVPKKDLNKHRQEILSLKEKVEEERERLRFLKENGDLEEYVLPKRSNARPVYSEPHTLPDMDMGGDSMTDVGLDTETESYDTEMTESDTEGGGDEDATLVEDEDSEDPFSDKNRWKRGVLEDPDSDSW